MSPSQDAIHVLCAALLKSLTELGSPDDKLGSDAMHERIAATLLALSIAELASHAPGIASSLDQIRTALDKHTPMRH